MLKEHSQTAAVGEVFEALLLHLHKDGSPFHAEVRGSTILLGGKPCLLTQIGDVSRRVRTEKNMGKRSESQMRKQATLLAIFHTLASTLEFRPGLILDQLREIIAYTYCGWLTLKDSTLVTLAVRGTSQLEQSLPFNIPLPEPEALDKPIRIANVCKDDDLQAKLLRSLSSDGASAPLQGTHAWMWNPLAVRGRVLGGIGLAHPKPSYFTPHPSIICAG